MDAESFFARWSKRNAEAAAEKSPSEAPSRDDAQLPAPQRPPPSLEDVERLTPDSDFTPFVARGVDEQVRRSAMKKLFADPRFNVMDGLDVYIEDFHSFTPIPAAVLAALNHAQSLLDPLAQLDDPLMKLLGSKPQDDASAPSLADEQDGVNASENASTPDTPPLPEEHDSHDDPIQGM